MSRFFDKVESRLHLVKKPNGKNEIKEIANEFIDEVLGKPSFPDEAMAFVVQIISDENLFKINGIEEFIVNSLIFKDAFSAGQKRDFVSAVSYNYKNYKSEKLCWIICDFIARDFPPAFAFDVFDKIRHGCTKNGEAGVALGLDVLILTSSDPDIKKRASVLLNSF